MTSLLKESIKKGIPSYCTANPLVIKALLINAKNKNEPVLIEATANQVDQFGGYTGMKPKDFINFVFSIADEVGCKKELLFFGGDHLGPLTFKNDDEEIAMQKAKDLVFEYVKAGFLKIHLDTSMKLNSDDVNEKLEVKVVAKRGVELYKECMRAFSEMPKNSQRPVFVIGSEVPIPGGATENEEGIEVTKVEDFYETVNAYKNEFIKNNLEEAFLNDVVAVVVQPGVEFSDSSVFLYDDSKAKELSNSIKRYENLVFEGHSTDYQPKEKLKEMVRDKISILKVGPALTYRLKQALYMLSFIEKELIPLENRANFIEVIEKAMIENPKNWKNHYHGNELEQKLSREYSYSDRSRYYLNVNEVQEAISTLINNLKNIEIPLNMLYLYMPNQYKKIMQNKLSNKLEDIIFDAVLEIAKDYEYACE